MIKALIFDLDGTLVDSETLHYRAWENALLQNGVPSFSFEEFLRFIGTSNEKVATEYIKSHNITKNIVDLVLEKQSIYMELLPEIQLCPGVKEMLNRFHGKMKMAVASSSHKKEIMAILGMNDLLKYFSYVIGGDMVREKKPDPEIYLRTQSFLQLHPGECVAFEDSAHGLNAAKNAGMYGVAIPNMFTQNNNFDRADCVVASFNEVDVVFLSTLLSGSCKEKQENGKLF